MSGFGTAAAAVLVAVFVWAALAKARAPDATRRTAAALGLPAARHVAVLLPVAEAGVALLLLLRPRAGAVAALLLLAVFSALLVAALRRGVKVACGCFGTTSTAVVSAADLVRNALLAGLAVLALADPVPRAPELPAVIGVVTAAVTGWVLLGLVALRRDTGRLWDNTVPPRPEPGSVA